jgi:nicotinate-nucleotide adenylyltransferase
MRRRGAPAAYPGEVIGLYGGTFDPAHDGHAHVAETALKRLGASRIWWLVSPQNPLKSRQADQLAARVASARAQARRWRMRVTTIETLLGSRYTIDTVTALQRRYPGVRFIWIMGADSLADFPRWGRWREIARRVAILIISRPGVGLAPRLSGPFARQFARARRRADEAASLTRAEPPVWCFLPARLHAVSSTALRVRRR